MKRHLQGFTLVELMIVVAIIGILAAIAYPSYQSAMIKSHRADAQSYMMDLVQKQQQYFTDYRAYANQTTLINLDPVPSKVGQYYSITVSLCHNSPCTTPDVPPYTLITATPQGTQASDVTLTIDNTGARTPSNMW